LQSAGAPGAFAESVTFSLAGDYRLSYMVAGRPDNGEGAAGNLGYEVLLDSMVISNGSTTTAQPFTARTIDFVATTPGAHTVTFQALASPNSGDDTGFFDVVTIQPVPEPTVDALLALALIIWLFWSVQDRRQKN
jgi:hypothetical protein